LNCDEVLEKLSDFLDEDARAELCRAIEQHLQQCHDCRFEVDSVRKSIMLYQADNRVDVPVAVSSRLQAALAREYQAAKQD